MLQTAVGGMGTHQPADRGPTWREHTEAETRDRSRREFWDWLQPIRSVLAAIDEQFAARDRDALDRLNEMADEMRAASPSISVSVIGPAEAEEGTNWALTKRLLTAGDPDALAETITDMLEHDFSHLLYQWRKT